MPRALGLARTREPLDLRDVLVQTIDELRASHDRDIRLEGADSSAASGDRERLLQLFSNLIANAVVHGKPDVPVTARLLDGTGDLCVVEIHNFGVIPNEVRATLFEPFRRARSATKGLGLGLYIARQIAHAHGGDIEVASSETRGTVFTVKLPRTPAVPVRAVAG